ncbi:P-loop containing nucleoside triphosphate hydrolase protein [Lentinula detonsa]|uniref:P-loop containing nucleoside triphosphate hydrolase protein n=1 Tax=Lentinula detonsa TaxID=2804962 RepID=A0AA38PYG2_9AGAR|nr:P-loop containing nucleoside triphosphate hydrolase protein [Lentinula detonsa]
MTVPQRTIKLVVIGAAGVGKTSMRGQYISQRFSTGYRATIGADFITKVVQVGEDSGEMVTLQIWDTAGQERFSSLSSAFFRGADAALLVFDVNTPDSLHALKKWWEEFKVHAPLEDDELGSFCCVVVGNKLDLDEGRVSRVSYEQARTFMDTLVPPELYHDREEDSDEEDDPLSASQMTATPIRMHSKPAHQLLSPSSSITTSQPRLRSRSKSTEPHLTRSIYASSSVSGLSVYHTPSSSVYNHYDSARSSPDLNSVSDSGSYPPRSLPPLIIGNLGNAGSLGSLSGGNTSAVTLTPSNWDKFDSTRSGQHQSQDGNVNYAPNGDVRSRYDSINSVASSASAADSFFSAYSAHTHLSNASSSSHPSSAWRPYPHSPSLAPPLKSPSHSQHSNFHSNDSSNNFKHAFPSPFLSTSPHLHSYPRSHLGLEIDPDSPIPSSQSELKIPQTPDTGYRLFFASAKTGEGVNDVFEYIAKRVVGQWDWESKQAQRRREAGEEDEHDADDGGRDARARASRGGRGRGKPNGIGNRNGIALNGLYGAANGVGVTGGNMARSWSGGMAVNLSSLNGVVGSMRGTGESNCCSS